jgi:hypothetical protein
MIALLDSVDRWSYPNDDNLRSCPHTASVLHNLLPDALGEGPASHVQGMAEFSRLEPGTVVKPHTGRSNTRIRLHLPLVVPQGELGIEVAGEVRRWRAGQVLAFDDSFVHRAWHNGSSEPRIVLIVDIWAPDLKSWEERWHSIDIPGRRRRFRHVATQLAGIDTTGWAEHATHTDIATHLNDVAEMERIDVVHTTHPGPFTR